MRNFYEDDFLNFVNDPKTAMILVKNVVDMCKSGGFHLTKFISNNRELLMSIPEDQRRNGVKNVDLIDDIPTKRLWVFSGIFLMTLTLSTSK